MVGGQEGDEGGEARVAVVEEGNERVEKGEETQTVESCSCLQGVPSLPE